MPHRRRPMLQLLVFYYAGDCCSQCLRPSTRELPYCRWEVLWGEAGATGKETQIPMTFIRAPHIAELGEGVKVLAALPDGTAVAVTYRNQLGATFHPELDEDMSIYTTFAQML